MLTFLTGKRRRYDECTPWKIVSEQSRRLPLTIMLDRRITNIWSRNVCVASKKWGYLRLQSLVHW
jgi:hypothetical protein